MKRHTRIMPAFAGALVLAGSWTVRAETAAAEPLQVASLDIAHVQTIDTTGLAGSSSAPALVMQAHAQALRPAPLPDQDFEAPAPSPDAVAAQSQASVQPSFYSRAKPFAGDGFAAGSTLDEDRANRQRPGGGMSLSIPVQ